MDEKTARETLKNLTPNERKLLYDRCRVERREITVKQLKSKYNVVESDMYKLFTSLYIKMGLKEDVTVRGREDIQVGEVICQELERWLASTGGNYNFIIPDEPEEEPQPEPELGADSQPSQEEQRPDLTVQAETTLEQDAALSSRLEVQPDEVPDEGPPSSTEPERRGPLVVSVPPQPARSNIWPAVIGGLSLIVAALICAAAAFLLSDRLPGIFPPDEEPTQQALAIDEPTQVSPEDQSEEEIEESIEEEPQEEVVPPTRGVGVSLQNYYFNFNEFRRVGAFGGGTFGFVGDFRLTNENRDLLVVDFPMSDVTVTDNFGDNPDCGLWVSGGPAMDGREAISVTLRRGEAREFTVACYPGYRLPSDVDNLTVTINTRISDFGDQTFEFEVPR